MFLIGKQKERPRLKTLIEVEGLVSVACSTDPCHNVAPVDRVVKSWASHFFQYKMMSEMIKMFLLQDIVRQIRVSSSISLKDDQIRSWPIDVITLPPKALVRIRKSSLDETLSCFSILSISQALKASFLLNSTETLYFFFGMQIRGCEIQ